MTFYDRNPAILGCISQERLSCTLLHIKRFLIEWIRNRPLNLIISVQLSVTYPVAIPVYASKGEKYSDYKNTKLRTKED